VGLGRRGLNGNYAYRRLDDFDQTFIVDVDFQAYSFCGDFLLVLFTVVFRCSVVRLVLEVRVTSTTTAYVCGRAEPGARA